MKHVTVHLLTIFLPKPTQQINYLTSEKFILAKQI